MRVRISVGLIAAIVCVATLLVAVSEPAAASHAGENGRLVFIDTVPQPDPHVTAQEIFTMDPDGSDLRRLTNDAGRTAERPGATDFVESANWVPKWSPNGQFIAYVHVDEYETYSIRLMDRDGALLRTITDDYRGVFGLSWSPDGRRLAFDGYGAGGDGIWTITVDGTDPQLLIGSPSNSRDGLWGIGEPEWSPTGNTIAFAAREPIGGRRGIYLMNPDGSNIRPLACGLDWSYGPEWDSTGRFLFCLSQWGTGDLDVWLTDVGTGETDLLVADPDDQHSVTVAPDGSEVIWVSDGDNGLWRYSDYARIAGFTGRSLDWQPIQRVPQPLGFVDPLTGKWYLTGDDGLVDSFYFGNPGDYPILGDWNCDGTTTPGMYRQSDGYVYLRDSRTQGVADIRFFFGNPGDLPIVGDFDGDGCDTVSIYRPTEGRVFIINQLGQDEGGLGQAEVAYYFGDPGDKPFVGDYNGDSVDTVGLHREATGLVYFRNTHTQGAADNEFIFGDPGDRLVAGDWNDDGADSPGLFRSANDTWYLRYTNTQGIANETLGWGQSWWLPVAG